MAITGCLLVALAGAALAAAPAARGASTTTLTLEGRGWGHGIGMSQYGAYGYALHGWKYGAIIQHYYTGVTLGKVSNVSIRVLLRSGASSFAVIDAATFNALWAAKAGTKMVHLGAGTTATVTWTGSSYRLRAGAKTWTAGAPITFAPTTSKLKLLTANDNGVVGHYRGRLRVVHLTDSLEIVNTLPLESYLLGVVPRESPASWPIEALKAQAVAARSYAYRATGGSGTFDVNCTTASQMYGGSRRRDQGHQPGGERHARRRAQVQGHADRRLLLLDLRRAYREHRECLDRRCTGSVSQGRARPLRLLLAVRQVAR